MVNLAFVNYFDNLVDSLDIPILKNWPTKEQILTISLEALEINSSLLSVPKMLKDFVHQFKHRKQIFDIEEEHIDEEREKLNTKFSSFLNSFILDVFLFVTTFVTIIITMVVIYVTCGHSELKTLVTNVDLQQLKRVEATDPRFQDIHSTCKTQWYMIALLLLILLGIVFIITSKIRKSDLLRGK